MAIFTASDAQTDSGKVRLMTIHSAKGLEFDVVFLVGLNEGIFPSRQTKNQAAMEEERRLAFVAMTRAREALYLSEAQGNLHTGSVRYPSRFIFEPDLPEENWNPPVPHDLREAASRMISLNTHALQGAQSHEGLKPGDWVEHSVFGKGCILSISDDQTRVTIQFDKLNTQRTLSAKARLKKVEGPGPETRMN